MPTPDELSRNHPVGAYEGAYNCDFLYRPARTCKMLTSGEDFCPVCAEQVSRRFFSTVDPITNAADGGAAVVANDDGTLTFSVAAFGNSTIRWTLDGEVIGEEPSLTLSPGEASNESSLEVSVEENRGFIRDRTEREQSTVVWKVRTPTSN